MATVISIDLSFSIPALLNLLGGIIIFVLCINYNFIRRKPEQILWMIIAFGGILTFISPPLIDWKYSRFEILDLPIYDFFRGISLNSSQTLHANVVAGALVIALPLALAVVLQPSKILYKVSNNSGRRKRTRRNARSYLIKTVVSILFVLMLSILILTQSRGGYLAAITSLLFVVTWRWPKIFYVTPLLIIALSAYIINIGSDNFFQILGGDVAFGGTNVRLEIWRRGWLALSNFPLTGIGLGTYLPVTILLFPSYTLNSIDAPHAHNLFLQIGLDLGIVGLLSYILLVLNLLAKGAKCLYRFNRFSSMKVNEHYSYFVVGSVAAILGMLLHGLLDSVIWGTNLAFLPWLLFAFMANISFLEPNHGEYSVK